MATAEELLNGVTAVDKTLVISNDLRTITIPPSVHNLGVESDNDVLRLSFRMPRYIGSIDLSQFSIRINYLNAQAEGDVYVVNDVAVDSNYISFSWLVGPAATRYKGDVKFNVCLVKFTDDGYVDKEYNTTIATLKVLEGLETDESLIEQYSDLLEQWKREIDAIEDAANLAIRGYLNKAPGIAKSATGNPIIATDAPANDYLRGLKLFGKTTQVTTTGKNLFDSSKLLTAANWTVDENGVYSGRAFDLMKVCSETNPYMTFSGIDQLTLSYYGRIAEGQTPVGTYFMIVYDDGSKEHLASVGSTTETYYAKTTPAGKKPAALYFSYGNASGIEYLRDIQIEVGTTATAYEPYSGGIPSPNPDYPQDLVSLGDKGNVVTTVCGKNLFNPSKLLAARGWAVDENGVYSGMAGNMPCRKDLGQQPYATFDGVDRLTLSFYGRFAEGLTPAGLYFIFEYDDGTTQSFAVKSSIDTHYSYTTKEEAKPIALYFSYGNAGGMHYLRDIQIEVGATATAYEPYVGNTLAASTPNGLPGIPVTSDGNYLDTSGQQWVCDEIDFARGVYIQRVGEITFKGIETLQETASNYVYTKVNFIQQPKPSSRVVSTHMTVAERINSAQNLMFPKSVFIFSSVDNFKAHLLEQSDKGTPLTCLYELASPIETPLSDEELAAFAALHTNKYLMTVYNDSGCPMTLEYNVDTKTYIDSAVLANGAIRDINSGKLTDAEKQLMSSLTVEYMQNNLPLDSNLAKFATLAYTYVGVNVSDYLDTVHKVFTKMFDANNKAPNGHKFKLMEETEANRNHLAMLLPGSYGDDGSGSLTAHGYKYELTGDDYRVGDLFCARYTKTMSDGTKSSNCYFIAVYLGNNQFLMYEDYGNVSGPRVVYLTTYDKISKITTASVTDVVTVAYFYVLRPENIAITDVISLQKKLAALEARLAALE